MDATLSRRGFVTAATAISASRVMGANDRIRLGIVGSGNRGRHLMNLANQAGGIQWVAVCDAYDDQAGRAAKVAGMVERTADYRRVLDRKDIDAVIVATWDNTHCEIATAALEAGKDLYIEKPMTLHPMEGHRIVQAARKHQRILQTGTQQRSYPHFIEAKERFIDSGQIGKITMVRTIWNGNGAYRNMAPPKGMETKPAGLDWDACQRNARQKYPWQPKRYFNHYVYWDYSTNAQMGGLFVHMVDVVHWYCKVEKPLAADCFGGVSLTQEDRDTADNINAILEYPGKLFVTFEANVTDMILRENADIVFMGTGGRLNIFRYGYKFYPAEGKGKEPITSGTSGELHVANWLDSIRTRRKAACDEMVGHYSAMACHMCNIAYLERRRVEWRKEWDIA